VTHRQCDVTGCATHHLSRGSIGCLDGVKGHGSEREDRHEVGVSVDFQAKVLLECAI
jgi:hypothetical protein